MRIRKLRKTLTDGGLTYLGECQKLHLFSMPPDGRLLAVYQQPVSDAIRATLDELRQVGCVVLPLEETSSFIAALIGSLAPDEHELLAEALISEI